MPRPGLSIIFVFIPAIRRVFDGPLIVAGGIADSLGIAGALALGTDIACRETRFSAAPESGVPDGHPTMTTEAGIDEIMASSAMNGVPADWMRGSIERVGLDHKTMPQERTEILEGVMPWRDIWSAGKCVGLIDKVMPVTELVDQLAAGLRKRIRQRIGRGNWLACREQGWRPRWSGSMIALERHSI